MTQEFPEFQVRDTLPDPSHGEPQAASVPFAFMALVTFFAVDSLERWAEVGWHVWTTQRDNEALGAVLSPWHPWLPTAVLWATVSGSLAALLWARSPTARWLAMFLLVAHFIYLGHTLAISQPGLWLYMNDLGRARVLLSAIADGLGLAWLISTEARSYIDLPASAGP